MLFDMLNSLHIYMHMHTYTYQSECTMMCKDLDMESTEVINARSGIAVRQ